MVKNCLQCFAPLGADGKCPRCGAENAAYAPEPHHLPPGTILHERYLIGKAMGEGGFGITYAGYDQVLTRKVAVKEFFPGGAVWRNPEKSLDVLCRTSQNLRQTFEVGRQKCIREAQSLAKLDDIPAIVRILDYFEENQTAYIIMEFVEGVTLQSYVRRLPRRMTMQGVLSLLRPVADALEQVHRRGFVHRDVSPDNIMILQDGTAKLLDFGAVKAVAGGGSATENPIVKRGFSPIELYSTTGLIGAWTDVYALAATFYCLLIGTPPDEPTDRLLGDTVPQMLDGVCTSDEKEAMQRALSVRPQNRQQSVAELMRDLGQTGSVSQPESPQSAVTTVLLPKAAPLPEPAHTPQESEATVMLPKPDPQPPRPPVSENGTATVMLPRADPHPQPPEPPQPPKKRVSLQTVLIAVLATLVAAIVIGVIVHHVSDSARQAEFAVAENDGGDADGGGNGADSGDGGEAETTKAETTKAETPIRVYEKSRGELVEFGAYPQTKVTDAGLIASLNARSAAWQSYGYYSGTGRNDGNMRASDYMQFCDVTEGGETYRGVQFSRYRPMFTGRVCSEDGSFQDDNGYYTNTVYWFRYDPLQWRVLDPNNGLVLCETIIDSQPYQNYVLDIEDWYWGDANRSYFANNYEKSYIRRWLNNDFYSTAFTASQQEKIVSTTLDNRLNNTVVNRFDSPATTDKVYLLSAADALNSAYGFRSDGSFDAARLARGSDYAKCQGLFTNRSNGNSYWRLRTAGTYSYMTIFVDDGAGSDSHTYCVSNTDYGVRPALRLSENA